MSQGPKGPGLEKSTSGLTESSNSKFNGLLLLDGQTLVGETKGRFFANLFWCVGSHGPMSVGAA